MDVAELYYTQRLIGFGVLALIAFGLFWWFGYLVGWRRGADHWMKEWRRKAPRVTPAHAQCRCILAVADERVAAGEAVNVHWPAQNTGTGPAVTDPAEMRRVMEEERVRRAKARIIELEGGGG